MTPTKKLIERAKNLFSSEIGVLNMNEISDTIDELIEHLERHERALKLYKEELRMMICENVCDQIDVDAEAILNPQEKGEM